MGHRFGRGSNAAQTGVSYKEIRKCALQHHNPDALIGLKFPAEFVELLRQNFIKKIYRRVIDADECNSRIKREPETFVIRVSHGTCLSAPQTARWPCEHRRRRRGTRRMPNSPHWCG